nr:unnamed protein product [Spodoptera littoralis]
MAKKLHYFNFIAIAEPIRYILHYTKQEFEDVRHDHRFWPNAEFKEKLPFGQFPLYEEGDRLLTQSLAIAKYVARGTDLIPSDPWTQAVLDAAVYTIYDYWSKVVTFIREKDPEKKKELKRELLDETIDFFFSRLDKDLKENGGYFSGKLSWVEFVLCGLVEASNYFLDTELDKKYPRVEALIKKIKVYRESKSMLLQEGLMCFKQ